MRRGRSAASALSPVGSTRAGAKPSSTQGILDDRQQLALFQQGLTWYDIPLDSAIQARMQINEARGLMPH